MPAWMRKKSEPKKVEAATLEAINEANKSQNSQATQTGSNQNANKVIKYSIFFGAI
jgi:hypothetical protein